MAINEPRIFMNIALASSCYRPDGTVPSSRGTSAAEGVTLHSTHYTLNGERGTMNAERKEIKSVVIRPIRVICVPINENENQRLRRD